MSFFIIIEGLVLKRLYSRSRYNHIPTSNVFSVGHIGSTLSSLDYHSVTVVENPKLNRIVQSPIIVGIAGGSASGKSTLTMSIIKILGENQASCICHDNYYKDLSHLTAEQRANSNFDHPNSLDSELLASHLRQLKNGEAVNIPSYDFKTHARLPSLLTISPRKVIIVEGILLFADASIANLMDMKIFVDTKDEIRLNRRLKRDTTERARTVEGIIEQYDRTVRPMYELFVEPTKDIADIIVTANECISDEIFENCINKLNKLINAN